MNKTLLLDKLNKATDRAATFSIQRGIPIHKDKGVWIGNTIIEKNSKGFYDILSLDRKPLYEDISIFDIAVIISQRYTSGEFGIIKKILILEDKFAKHQNDMIHYLHNMRGAQKRKDYDKMAILEDKFQISELLAKNAKDGILNFKRTK